MLSTVKKGLIRSFQTVAKPIPYLVNVPVPELLSGPGSLHQLPGVLKTRNIASVLVVTDPGIVQAGLLEGLESDLGESGVRHEVYSDVQPNPTIKNVEDGVRHYNAGRFEAVVTIGGGSAMDCAKIIGARANNPKHSVRDMKGMFRVRKDLPPVFAISTTAGTGSEATGTAVITDPDTHEKFAISTTKLVPPVAILDPELMVGLPPHITSTTGMDALTHAIEAYIGIVGLRYSMEYAAQSVHLIFNNLVDVYKDGTDLEKRNNMALASHYAGLAFARVGIGYVHAIAHTLGGLYGVPHGLANAVILPHVLDYSREAAEDKLASLAVAAGLGREGESPRALSFRFIKAVKAMNASLDIPDSIKEIQEEDVPEIAKRALAEAHPIYPVPKLMDQKECEDTIYRLVA